MGSSMDFEYEQQMRHKKRANRKSPPKAKHKHKFEPCVFEFDGIRLDEAHGFVPEPKAGLGTYCTICGKIGSFDSYEWVQWVPINPGSTAGRIEYNDNAKQELNPETRTLPTFRLDDIWSQKYVSACVKG